MLAKVFDPEKHNVAGWYISEKLDGGRCFWDGGITRDIPTASVPWAGLLNPKTGQPKTKIKPTATGLWSRYGNPIMAPDWFLNTLPACPLDGELWAGRGNFQKVMSTIRKDKPVDEEWKQIQFAVFGSPDFEVFGADGEIKNSGQMTDIRGVKKFMSRLPESKWRGWRTLSGNVPFTSEIANLNDWVDNLSDTHFMVLQTKLPEDEEVAKQIVEAEKKRIIEIGGEGVFLRAPDSKWTPKRVWTSLKCKGALDAEGTVVGFTAGRKTDKGSKHLGKIGALVLDYDGKRLEISGLTNEEREFETIENSNIAKTIPGEDMPSSTEGKMFKKGDRITFTYRELTDAGVPKEARYLRPRGKE